MQQLTQGCLKFRLINLQDTVIDRFKSQLQSLRIVTLNIQKIEAKSSVVTFFSTVFAKCGNYFLDGLAKKPKQSMSYIVQ